MSRALRGDFERLRERGVSTTLATPAQAAEPPEPEVVAEPQPVVEPEPKSAPERDGVAADEALRGQPTGEVTTSRPGLFARLTGR